MPNTPVPPRKVVGRVSNVPRWRHLAGPEIESGQSTARRTIRNRFQATKTVPTVYGLNRREDSRSGSTICSSEAFGNSVRVAPAVEDRDDVDNRSFSLIVDGKGELHRQFAVQPVATACIPASPSSRSNPVRQVGSGPFEAAHMRTLIQFAKSFSLFGDVTHVLRPPVAAGSPTARCDRGSLRTKHGNEV